MPEFIKTIVVGSGPSGVAAIAALIEKGEKPTVLDGGLIPVRNPENQIVVTGQNSSPGQKSWFGSFVPFTQLANDLIYSGTFQARASYSLGGLSRVWGATFEYYKGISLWNENCIPATEDYALIENLVPRSTTSFTNESDCQILGDPRSAKIMNRLSQKVKANDWDLRPSTLAINQIGDDFSSCSSCASCLKGCPQDSIWFSGNQILKWQKLGLIDYRPGIRLVKFDETSEVVYLECQVNETSIELLTNKLFLATGAISTGALIVSSNYAQKVVVKDTSTAFLAGISLAKSNKAQLKRHVLSQWWATDLNREVAFQMYPPDEIHFAKILKDYHLPYFFAPLVKAFLSRVHPIIAYLNQEASDSFSISKSGNRILVNGKTGKHTKRNFFKKLKSFSTLLNSRSFYVPLFLTSFSQPGAGYHFGASLPQGSLTDHLGRLPQVKNIHIVDSSVLPELEVGSITPTVMVNAARIARTAMENDA